MENSLILSYVTSVDDVELVAGNHVVPDTYRYPASIDGRQEDGSFIIGNSGLVDLNYYLVIRYEISSPMPINEYQAFYRLV